MREYGVTPSPEQVTRLLINWGNGDKSALDKLMPMVYSELRRLARHYMRRERPDHTLQTTALANEVYLRVIDQSQVGWQSRAHFFAIAAKMMRHLLVDYARSRQCAKRVGNAQRVSLDDVAVVSQERAEELLEVDGALRRLAAIDPRKSQIVELRYFSGLSVEETAEVVGVSGITVKREWAKAKAWLYRELRR